MPKACKQCKAPRTNWSQSTLLNAFCGPVCATDHALLKQEAAKLKRQERQRRESRAKHKGMGHWQGITQKVVNEFVRERDYFKPCMTHGPNCPNQDKGWDAGHFIPVGMGGGSPLRFNTWNIHKQCRPTNRGAHNRKHFKQSADQMNEARLRARIGDKRVDWLKGPHENKNYNREQLKRMRMVFAKRTRLYEKLREGRGKYE